MTKSKRYTILDALRGIAIISMVLYHALWDIVYIFGVNFSWFRSGAAHIWQQSILWTFILISGFCWSMGKKQLKRGMTVLVCSAVISAVTAIVMPENLILFGVLSFMGAAMILTVPFDKIFLRISPYIGVIISGFGFLIIRNINLGNIGFGDKVLINLPDVLYADNFTAYLGFPPEDFMSQDYVPILPWLFMYWTGYFMYRIFKEKGLLKYLGSVSVRPLEWLGRHSLIIYMIHQPMIYGILFIMFNIIA